MNEQVSEKKDENQAPENTQTNEVVKPPLQPGAEIKTDPARELEKSLKEAESKYLYLYAEFENYKKRTFKERLDIVKFSFESAALDFMQVMDNMKRALEHIPEGTDKNLCEGLRMVLAQFESTLKKQGVEPIETIGKPFDPNLHEATGQEPSDLQKGAITREQLRGFTLHGRLLRPAKVLLSQGKT